MSKFDQFIEDFDKTLNKDTSTIKTLTSPTTPPMESGVLAPSISNEMTFGSSHQRTTSTSTTASQSTPTKPRASSVSLHPLSPNTNTSNNNGSARKKGLNLNIAMGSRSSTPRKTTTTTATNTPAKKIINTSNTIKEGEGGELEGDMSDVLRKMASSEMKIIELKDELRLLQKKIQVEEEELAQLRSKVAWNLNHQSKPKKAISKKETNIEDGKNEKTGSYWSKPMTLLNQFDQMLQTEFEKLGKDQTEKDSDVLKGVSNSLWSFVSDVKSGLMGDEDFHSVGQQTAVKKKLKNKNGDNKTGQEDNDDEDDEKGRELVDFGNT